MAKKRTVKIGRAKGNIMPVTINGNTIEVPLKRRWRGKSCREVSFSELKSKSKASVKKLRDQGYPAFSKKYTKGNKSIHVVYQCKR